MQTWNSFLTIVLIVSCMDDGVYWQYSSKNTTFKRVNFSQDGKYVVINVGVQDQGTISALEIRKKRVLSIGTLPRFCESALDVAINGNNDVIAIIDDIYCWDLSGNKKYQHNIRNIKNGVVPVLTKDGDKVAIGHDNGILKIYLVQNMKEIFSKQIDLKVGCRLRFSDDGNLILIANGATVELYEISKNECLFQKKLLFSIEAVAFSSDNERIAFASGRRKFSVLSLRTGEIHNYDLSLNKYRKEFPNLGMAIDSLVFTLDNTKLVLGGSRIVFFDLRREVPYKVMNHGSVYQAEYMAFSKDGQFLIICSGTEIKIWEFQKIAN